MKKEIKSTSITQKELFFLIISKNKVDNRQESPAKSTKRCLKRAKKAKQYLNIQK